MRGTFKDIESRIVTDIAKLKTKLKRVEKLYKKLHSVVKKSAHWLEDKAKLCGE